MLRLDRTTRSLGIVLGGAVATNQLNIIVSGVERIPSAAATLAPVIGFTQIATTSGATDVTICAAPQVNGRVREIESIYFRNRDTAAVTASIEYDDNGTDYIIFTATLAVGDFVAYSYHSGWQLFDANGNAKATTGLAIGSTIVGGTATRVLFTGTGPVLADDSGFTFNTTGDILTVGAIDVAGTTAPTSGWYLPSADLIRTPNSATIDDNLIVSGNATLGDTSADTLTLNAGTWTIESNYTATRAAGTLATGTVAIATWTISYTGDVGGATNARAHGFNATAQGANSLIAVQNMRFGHTVDTTAGTITNSRNLFLVDVYSGEGAITTWDGIAQTISLSSTGNITNALAFSAGTTSLTSTGSITTNIGFRAGNLGHATLVTNALGFDCLNMTAALTLTAAFRSQMTSGTGKWGFYASGTADNAFAGNVRIGSVVAPTVALDVTGASLISTTLGVTGVATLLSTLELGHATDTTLARTAAGRVAIEGIGIVKGPATSTDNAIARWDSTTGELTQNSGNTIDDSNITTLVNKLYPSTDAATAQAVSGIYAGNGAPNNANGANGDFYFRGDGTVAGNTVAYHREAGAWVAFTTT